MKEQIKNLIEEFEDEMMAMGAWCGHAYAPSYLSDIETKAKEILKGIDNYDAKHALFELSTDYDVLITKVYGADNLSSSEKGDISDALNEVYLRKLENAMEIIRSKGEEK